MVRNSNLENSDEESLFALNEVVADRYRVTALLGKGGMGAVYEVEQIHLGKVFALKAILKSATTETNIRRFQSEAKVNFALNHPNIISVYDFGLLNDDTPFLVMELLRGETLATRIKRSTMSVEEVLPIFSQICSGLRHAHEHNVIHRDIKPSNIMLLNNAGVDTKCSIKILDFGIAKLVQDDSENLQALTRTGEIFGSPMYMSPEQCSGGKIDKRSDIYSLGCVLFEALTGTPPFVGDNMLTTMVMHQSAAVPTLKEASLGEEFPEHLERMVARMLEKNPAQRYQDTAEIERHLTHIRDGSDTNMQLTSELQASKPESSPVSAISLRRGSFYLLIFSTISAFAVCGSLTAHILMLNSHKPVSKATEVNESSSTHYSSAAEDHDFFKRLVQDHSNKIDPTGKATDADLKIFNGYKYAQSISFVDTKVTENGLSNFKNSKLLDVDVNHGNIKTIAAFVEEQPYLQSINVASTLIRDADLKKLAHLKMLTELDIRNCSLSEKGVRQLLASKTLLRILLTEKDFAQGFIDEIRQKMPQCTIGENGAKSRERELYDRLAKIPEEKKFDPLYQLVAQGPSDNSELATLSMLEAKRCYEAHDLRRTKEKLQAAQDILIRNGDKTAFCTLSMAKATLAKLQHRFPDFDKAMGELSKDYFNCYRHDRGETWDNLTNLTSDLHGPGQFTNTIKLCEQALAVLNEEYEPVKGLRQIFAERAAWLSWECADVKHGINAAEENFKLCQTSGNALKRAKSGIILAHFLPVNERRKQLYLEGMKQIEDLHFPAGENLREHYCDAASSMVFISAVEKNYDQAVLFARQGFECAKKITIDNRKRENLFAQLLIQQLKRANKTLEAKELEEKYRAHG